jgi:hypothetical protein
VEVLGVSPLYVRIWIAARFTAVDASRNNGTVAMAMSSVRRFSRAAKHCQVFGDAFGAKLGVESSLDATKESRLKGDYLGLNREINIRI